MTREYLTSKELLNIINKEKGEGFKNPFQKDGYSSLDIKDVSIVTDSSSSFSNFNHENYA